MYFIQSGYYILFYAIRNHNANSDFSILQGDAKLYSYSELTMMLNLRPQSECHIPELRPRCSVQRQAGVPFWRGRMFEIYNAVYYLYFQIITICHFRNISHNHQIFPK